MDNKSQFSILDILNVLSFYIGIKNLEENLSQGQAGEMLNVVVDDIHKHLKEQDIKLEKIMEALNEKDKEIS